AGFYVETAVNGEITKNKFEKNSATGNSHYGAGFYIGGNLPNNIKDNVFNANSAHHGGCFWVNAEMQGDVANNLFQNNNCSYCAAFVISKLFGNFYSNHIENNKNEAFSISLMQGDFYNNVITNTASGRYTIYFKSFWGKVYNNLISNNKASQYGIFYINTTFTGSIINNNFVNNSNSVYGGAINVNQAFDGKIDRNLFSSNSARIGGAIYLAKNGGNSATISNNFFVKNFISGNPNANGDKQGSGIHSNQNITLINNTFIGEGHENESSILSLSNNTDHSTIKNNIFTNCHTAILEEGELTIPTQHNDFYSISFDILKRNKESYGNDLFFLEMIDILNVFFDDNIDSSPNLMGEIIDKGTWTKDAFYQSEQNCTVFSDNTKNWPIDQWKGAFINLSGISEKEYHFVILSNTKNEIIIANNIVSTGFGKLEDSYSIDDYRLKSNSLLKDAGTEDIGNIDITKDFEGEYRPQDSKTDIGADEFFTGKIAPSILTAEIPATEISSSAAILNARLNALGKNTSYYFEYGTTKNYGNNTDEMTVGDIQDYTTVSFLIINLEQDTLYHFRLIASNDDVIGAVGADQSFKTLRTNVIIKGNIKGTIAGYSSLNIK
ncbi:hypothetical protein MHK_003450, partial [Candidatus Magnetomorum sp. HK-1]